MSKSVSPERGREPAWRRLERIKALTVAHIPHPLVTSDFVLKWNTYSVPKWNNNNNLLIQS
jgi:hypothetical protein